MKRLPRHKLGTLKVGEIAAEIRFINTDGETEVWMVEASDEFLSSIRRDRKMPLAYIDDGTDVRIANQRRSINILLDHLKEHCPLFSGEVCDYRRGKRS